MQYKATLSEEIVARGLAAMILNGQEICISELIQSGYPDNTIVYVKKIVANCFKCVYNFHVQPDRILCDGWKGDCKCLNKDDINNNNNNNISTMNRWELDCKTCGTPGTCYYCAINHQVVCEDSIWCSECTVVNPPTPSIWSNLPSNPKAEVPDHMLGSDSE